MPCTEHSPAVVRLAVALCLLGLLASGCAKPFLRGYETRADAYRTAARLPPAVNATAGEGYVDVLCLAGDSAGRAPYDTLFGCLLRARETHSGTIILPRGVYLGHVSELMVRSLKFYCLEERFERYLGYRLVMRFRRAQPAELDARDQQEDTELAARGAGEAAAFVVGLGYVPLSPVIFLVESGFAGRERRQVAEEARQWGLPEPDRGAVEVTWEQYKRRYARLWDRVTGERDGPAPEVYVVEECYLEKPGRQEVLEVVRRRDRGGRTGTRGGT